MRAVEQEEAGKEVQGRGKAGKKHMPRGKQLIPDPDNTRQKNMNAAEIHPEYSRRAEVKLWGS